ncbi:hypothetical protein M0802_012454 [Mischocyttarus mexicanus]|nr:hypothetical protein M0802_012454 [Mischocyttarus mexicanus]
MPGSNKTDHVGISSWRNFILRNSYLTHELIVLITNALNRGRIFMPRSFSLYEPLKELCFLCGLTTCFIRRLLLNSTSKANYQLIAKEHYIGKISPLSSISILSIRCNINTNNNSNISRFRSSSSNSISSFSSSSSSNISISSFNNSSRSIILQTFQQMHYEPLNIDNISLRLKLFAVNLEQNPFKAQNKARLT